MEEEQAAELEALAAIYGSELGVYNRMYPDIKFRLRVRSDQGGDLADIPDSHDVNEAAEEAEDSEDEADAPVEDPLNATLILSLPSGYPETETPRLRLRGLTRRLGPDRKAAILVRLQEVAEENLGMQSTFSIVSELQERLTETSSELISAAEAAVAAAKRAEEEAEEARFRGTIVTQESFLAWRANFNEEMGIAKKAREEAEAKARKRATGKEQFLQDATLNLSDIQLIKEAVESVPDTPAAGTDPSVEVDESLFEDGLDDLDLED